MLELSIESFNLYLTKAKKQNSVGFITIKIANYRCTMLKQIEKAGVPILNKKS